LLIVRSAAQQKRGDADEDSDNNDDDAFNNNAPVDLVDMEIEDKAAFEARRREVESLYEAWDARSPPVLSWAETLNVLRAVCVTSYAQLDEAFRTASATVNLLSAEFDKWKCLVEEGRATLSDFQQWEVANLATYYQVRLPSFFLCFCLIESRNVDFLSLLMACNIGRKYMLGFAF
jgi:hypothetical protein